MTIKPHTWMVGAFRLVMCDVCNVGALNLRLPQGALIFSRPRGPGRMKVMIETVKTSRVRCQPRYARHPKIMAQHEIR